ncbi:MAG: Fur family transcriptional regulator [Beduini sp.]|uniref:Fur family transcriptional regulator n=1 Tax=Beduini sp. TaxID=1922300 RepID=UPI0011C7341C
MKTTRYSKQREAILLELQNRTDHPTADQVYYTLKQKYPELSLGTVYRNLGFLADNGDILKLDVGDGTYHYDGTITPHVHFVCSSCNEIYDIVIKEDIYQQIADSIDHQAEKINITIEGQCVKCHAKSKN